MAAVIRLPRPGMSADEIGRVVFRTSRPWLDQIARLRRDGTALLAKGELSAGLAKMTDLAELDTPPSASPNVRAALQRLKTSMMADLLQGGLAVHAQKRK